MSSPPEPDEAPANAERAGDRAEESAPGWATADELATRHAVSRRTIFRWLASGQVASRDVAGVTQYRLVAARAPTKGATRGATPPPPAVATLGTTIGATIGATGPEPEDARARAERIAEDELARRHEGEPLSELAAELAERLERVEAQVGQLAHARGASSTSSASPRAADARAAAGELEQARLLTELATRHAEQSRADLVETKRQLADARRALEIERERAYRLALVATLPWWQFRARRAMLAEIAAMKALALPAGDEDDG